MKKIILTLTVAIPLMLLGIAGYFYHIITSPNSTEHYEVSIRINPGQSFKKTSSQLYSKNLLKYYSFLILLLFLLLLSLGVSLFQFPVHHLSVQFQYYSTRPSQK